MARNHLLYLVDDDVDDHEIFKAALAQVDEKTALMIADNGREALQVLSTLENLPDYIFVDLNMPRMGGIQFITELKKTEALHHIPVIVYSTSNHPDDRGKAMEAGADKFITKPAKYSELCDLLRNLLGLRV